MGEKRIQKFTFKHSTLHSSVKSSIQLDSYLVYFTKLTSKFIKEKCLDQTCNNFKLKQKTKTKLNPKMFLYK